MKHLKKFENFEPSEEMYELEPNFSGEFDDMESSCEPCMDSDEDDDDYDIELPDDPMNRPMTLEKRTNKMMTYKKSGLKSPEKADLNKDKKISSYEKKRGSSIEKAIENRKKKGLK